jgi:sRNA-binding carbon storage regulator CsrA
MLVLTLKRDQVIRIGPDVLVMLVRGENGSLTLGITAPADWKIERTNPGSDGAATNASSISHHELQP